MKALAAFLFVFLIVVPFASAQTERAPNITFIPENISIGSAFVMLAGLDTGPGEVVRISVITPFYGHIPKVGTRWLCYFSNTDPSANCGPNPFSFTEEQLIITAFNQSGCIYNCEFEPLLNLTVGNITLKAGAVVTNTTAFIDVIIDNAIVDYVNYNVYNYKFEDAKINGTLTKVTPTKFSGNISLDYGTWWIAFYASDGQSWGSYLLKVVVGVEQLAEPIVLAFGPHIDVTLGPGQTEWTSSPICCVRNTLDKELELSTEVTPALAPYLSIQLENPILGPYASTTYTIKIKGLTGELNKISTLVSLVSNKTVVGQIPIDLWISILGGVTPTPTVTAGPLTISPVSWIDESVAGKTISKTFTIRNSEDQDYSLNWSVNTGLTGISLDMPATIGANSSLTVKANATFGTEGKRTGELHIKFDSMTAAIPVLIIVHKNISSDISQTAAKLDDFVANLTTQQASDLSSAIGSINTSLTTANSKFGAGRYDEAGLALEQAKAKLDMLKSVYAITPPAPGPVFDPAILVIPAVVVVVAIAGWFGWKFLKKMRKPKPIEKELEEEF